MTDVASNPEGLGRRMLKSPEAFRTISEVAADLSVPQHVLRFWETKFTQIRPLKRGGGRRYYRPEDVELLRRIRSLLYSEGYTIKGVQKVLRDSGGKLPAPEFHPVATSASAEVVPLLQARPEPARATGADLEERRKTALRTALDELAAVRAALKDFGV
jgi:DNA-binding transcriptional MerR regulator